MPNAPRSSALARSRRRAPLRLVGAGLVLAGGSACSRPVLPPVEPTLERWSRAAARGDSGALYSMLDSDSRRRFGRRGTEARVADAREELAARAVAIRRGEASVVVRATLRWPDGRRAEVVLQGGELRLAADGVRPSAAATPEEALAELRRAIASVDWSPVLGLLEPSARRTWLAERRALLEGLSEPHSLDVRVDGHRASVVVPGGFLVRLRQADGVWRVEAVE